MDVLNFQDIGRIPSKGDNVAIASKDLDAETCFNFNDQEYALSHSILEGHRFAVEQIPEGAHLYSWGLPFGSALKSIQPGEYLCNSGMLQALKLLIWKVELPEAAAP